MHAGRIAMSHRERDRLKVMSPVLEGRRTQKEGGKRCQEPFPASQQPHGPEKVPDTFFQYLLYGLSLRST